MLDEAHLCKPATLGGNEKTEDTTVRALVVRWQLISCPDLLVTLSTSLLLHTLHSAKDLLSAMMKSEKPLGNDDGEAAQAALYALFRSENLPPERVRLGRVFVCLGVSPSRM